jgi:hypothetical protein
MKRKPKTAAKSGPKSERARHLEAMQYALKNQCSLEQAATKLAQRRWSKAHYFYERNHHGQ